MNTESLDIKNLPSPIQTLISGKSYETDSMGKSGAGVFVFDDFVLKILDAHDKQISKQNDLSVQVMRWLQDKLSDDPEQMKKSLDRIRVLFEGQLELLAKNSQNN